MLESLVDVPVAPLLAGPFEGLGRAGLVPSCCFEKTFGSIGSPRQHHVFAEPAELLVDLFVHGELAGVDDAQPHAVGDGVIEEHRVHRLANLIVAAERERKVRHATRHVRRREAPSKLGGGLDEIEPVAVVFGDPGGDGEDVRVEDDVLGREVELGGQQLERPCGDVDLASQRVGLAVLVERHHDHRGAVVAAHTRLSEELIDTLLHRDRVDDRFALHALQPGLDDAELRRVDHHRHAGDVGFGGDQVEERDHRLLRVEQSLVHVDVDDLGAVLDLIAGDIERLGEVAIGDQSAELGRARDVGAFADVDEGNVCGERERFETGELQSAASFDRNSWAFAGDSFGDRRDVGRRGAAAAADDVDEPGLGELAKDRRGLFRRLVVAAESVGQAGVRVGADQRVGDGGQVVDVGPHLGATERAVEADRQRIRVPDRLPERAGRLTRERAARSIGDRAGDHQRGQDAGLRSMATSRPDRRLGVEGVEDRLDQQHIDASLDEPGDLQAVRLGELPKRHRAESRILDTGRQRQGDVGRSDGTGGPAWSAIALLRLIGGLPGQSGGSSVELDDQSRVIEPVLALGNGRARERVGGDDVGAGEQVRQVQLDDRIGLGENEEVVVARQR